MHSSQITIPNCPNCSKQYSHKLRPFNLRNCSHLICENCLRTQKHCPIDSKKIQLYKYTLNGFTVNKDIENLILKKQSLLDENLCPTEVKQYKTPKKAGKKSQAFESEVCLLHSKPADIICYDDSSLICASCALFGDHKGHKIQNINDFKLNLGNFTDLTIKLFDEIKGKESDLNSQVVQDYIKQTMKQHKQNMYKCIKSWFNKVIDVIKRTQRNTLNTLQSIIKIKRQQLINKISLKQIQQKTKQWYKDAQSLGNVMENVLKMKNLELGIKYLDGDSEYCQIVKNGQYLKIEYKSLENMIKNQIDNEIKQIAPQFNENLFENLIQLCTFSNFPHIIGKQSATSQKRISSSVTPNNFKQEQSKSPEKDNQDQNLLQIQQRGITSFQILPIDNKQQQKGAYSNKKIKEVQFHKPLPLRQTPSSRINSRPSSKSKKDLNKSINCNRTRRDSFHQKQKKKIDIPERYKSIYQDLKNDRCEVIDFGGAQLGDANITLMCDLVANSSKLKVLKLVRNKITDQVLSLLISSCIAGNVTSINLGQNSITDKSLDYLQKIDLGSLKNITLSLNKINRRNVKDRLDFFAQKGVVISI